MKKNYQKPAMQVVNIKMRYQFLGGSGQYTVTNVNSNVFNEEIGRGTGNARSRGFSGWDDEE